MGAQSYTSLFQLKKRGQFGEGDTGARIATGCRLKVEDFHADDDDATIKIQQ